MCPIFDRSQSNSLTEYQKILKRCTFGCKNVMNFACLTMKFHICNHTTVHAVHLGCMAVAGLQVTYTDVDGFAKFFTVSFAQ